MSNSTKTQNESPFFPLSPVVQVALIVLLSVSSFFAGTLWYKANPSSGKAPVVTGQQGNVVPTQPVKKPIDVVDLAVKAGVTKKDFEACLSGGEMTAVVKAAAQTGADVGIQGTPGTILIDTQTGKTTQFPGAVSITVVQSAVDKMLNGTAEDAKIAVAPVTEKDHVKGNANARLAMVIYSDYECPYCKRFHATATQALDANKDNLKLVFRQFPLPPTLHPNAQKFAEASECAAKLGGNDAFWKFTDALFNQ